MKTFLNLKKQYALTILLTVAGFLMLASHAFAASITALPEAQTVAIGGTVEVDVVLDSQGQNINTVSGSLVYNHTLLHMDSITTGGSAINFWVNQPALNPETGAIDFSGITPGGINSIKGKLFSVIFSGVANGESNLLVQNPLTYLNDGKGTTVAVTSMPQMISVTKNALQNTNNSLVADTIPPDNFTIIRTRDPNIFDGKWFVAFNSQDKGSGIAYYQVCESLFGKCITGTSPYLLTSQSSWYAITVKAYDQKNNVREAFLVAPKIIILSWLFLLLILGIILWAYVVYSKKSQKNHS